MLGQRHEEAAGHWERWGLGHIVAFQELENPRLLTVETVRWHDGPTGLWADDVKTINKRHLVQPSFWVHLSSLVQVVRSIVTASFHFDFFHLGRLLRQMKTSGSGWGVVFRWVACWWCLCVGMTRLGYDWGHLWNIFITLLDILAVLFQKKNWDRTHYDCGIEVDWSCGWVSTAHSNMWFSWVTEQSQDVAPFLLRTRASGSCFSGFHPCLTCSYPPKWQPAAHGNKQKLLTICQTRSICVDSWSSKL